VFEQSGANLRIDNGNSGGSILFQSNSFGTSYTVAKINANGLCVNMSEESDIGNMAGQGITASGLTICANLSSGNYESNIVAINDYAGDGHTPGLSIYVGGSEGVTGSGIEGVTGSTPAISIPISTDNPITFNYAIEINTTGQNTAGLLIQDETTDAYGNLLSVGAYGGTGYNPITQLGDSFFIFGNTGFPLTPDYTTYNGTAALTIAGHSNTPFGMRLDNAANSIDFWSESITINKTGATDTPTYTTLTAVEGDTGLLVSTAITTKLKQLDYVPGGTYGNILATQGFVASAASGATAGLAQLYSPVFTGNPTAPTPSAGDDSESLATTAYVNDFFSGTTTIVTIPLTQPTGLTFPYPSFTFTQNLNLSQKTNNYFMNPIGVTASCVNKISFFLEFPTPLYPTGSTPILNSGSYLGILGSNGQYFNLNINFVTNNSSALGFTSGGTYPTSQNCQVTGIFYIVWT
jgi:hypothetical protein